jgi:hypothetical protein
MSRVTCGYCFPNSDHELSRRCRNESGSLPQLRRPASHPRRPKPPELGTRAARDMADNPGVELGKLGSRGNLGTGESTTRILYSILKWPWGGDVHALHPVRGIGHISERGGDLYPPSPHLQLNS